jgi:uncharacterized NAD-dependent epimerase/dehydratase family protein
MLNLDLSNRTLIVYLQDHLRSINGKTGLAVLRYSPHPIAAIIDTEYAGRSLFEVTGIAREVPIVASLEEAIAQGGDTLLIGLSPSGGRLTGHHREVVTTAISAGLSVINGLHDRLNHLNPHITGAQEIFDIRVPPPECLVVGFGRAQSLPNQRILTVGTDMAIGKMSTCIEFHVAATKRNMLSTFFATGQTGIVIAGRGIPLDAVPVDFASGAVEYGVITLSTGDCEWLWIEGQGSMLNPASTATLPLIRGSQPTGLVLVHRAGQTSVKNNPAFPIPPLKEVVAFYESVVKAAGTFPAAPVRAIALNTADLSLDDALAYIHLIERETGRPTDDVVRFGADRLLNAIIENR